MGTAIGRRPRDQRPALLRDSINGRTDSYAGGVIALAVVAAIALGYTATRGGQPRSLAATHDS